MLSRIHARGTEVALARFDRTGGPRPLDRWQAARPAMTWVVMAVALLAAATAIGLVLFDRDLAEALRAAVPFAVGFSAVYVALSSRAMREAIDRWDAADGSTA